MTPAKVICQFERLYLEGAAPTDLESTCGSFAEWLASAWEYLSGDERRLLLSVGAILWREGYNLTAPGATKDPW
jgi:hypothetical protein